MRLAHAARHDRRSAAGADGNDDVAAIDDGGKDESRMDEVVHHIDGQSDRLGACRHRHADVAGTGAEDRDHTGQIGGERIAGIRLDPRHVLGGKAGEVMIAVGREPADLRTGSGEQPQFGAREVARSNEQHLAALQIQKHRQIAHQILASPTWGLTEIIFYLSLDQGLQRENYFFSIAVQL